MKIYYTFAPVKGNENYGYKIVFQIVIGFCCINYES
jgi:hypothetical protein